MALIEKLNAIGDAIRSKTGGTAKLSLTDMVTAINSIQSGGSGGTDKIITGSFTPSSSDNVSGGSIKVTVSRLPRAVVVWTDNVGTNIDRYAPQAFSAVNPNATLSASQSALVSARYKSSTSSGSTLSQASAWSAYVWGNYTTSNASNYYYLVCCTSNRVYFKTNGNYCFRVGTTYKYLILFD